MGDCSIMRFLIRFNEKIMKYISLLLLSTLLFFNCKEEVVPPPPPTTGPDLIIKFRFDPNQERFDNEGNGMVVPPGNAGQSPTFHGLSIHYIELVQTDQTPYKAGPELYQGVDIPTNTPNPLNFTTAIDFDLARVAAADDVFHTFKIKDIPTGAYRHVRVSVSYQNYDIQFNALNIGPGIPDLIGETGRVASWLGYFTQLGDITPNLMTTSVNADVLQGFWAFETDLSPPNHIFNTLTTGQVPAGATTVVNQLDVPIPVGSCVIAGDLDNQLNITGDETEDLVLILSFSTNQSFEWVDDNSNGQYDIDVGAGTSEEVVDMGLRGLRAFIE